MRKLNNNFGKIFIITALILSLSTSPAYADIFGGTTSRNSDGYIEIYYDSSIKENGYSSMFGNALEEWTGISSKMKGIWHISSHATNCTTAYVADTSVSGKLGQCMPYKKVLGIGVAADYDENWSYTVLTVYDNQMEKEKMTDAQKTANIAHEMGHMQKLKHTSVSNTSIMKQGIQSIKVQSYDKNEIKRKWN